MDELRDILELIGEIFEAVGVFVVVVGSLIAVLPYGLALVTNRADLGAFATARQNLGRAILLGLEFLIAADLIDTVALTPTFESVAVLGLIVLVRSFLSTTLEMEIEGAWPWRRKELERAGEAKAR